MDYEIIQLEEKILVGPTARTKNSDSDMGQKIGALWTALYQGGIYPQIKNKANDRAIGLYSDYESDVNSEYSVTVGCEVTSADEIPERTVKKIISSGKYAKFIVKGNMVTAVADFWQKLWNMELDRSYNGDFEEYINNCTDDNAEIHIYIALN